MRLPCSSAHIVERFDVVRIFGFDANDSHIFLFKINHEKGRGDLNWKASQVPGNCDKKDRD